MSSIFLITGAESYIPKNAESFGGQGVILNSQRQEIKQMAEIHTPSGVQSGKQLQLWTLNLWIHIGQY